MNDSAENTGAPLKLNLGAGQTDIEGFVSIDRTREAPHDEAFPLPYPDGTVDEIRASHILEHFPHYERQAVLADWVRALKPGGLIRIAVPDFDWIVKQYTEGNPEDKPLEGYLMGGQSNENDFHMAIFNEGSLTRLMSNYGLLGICRWESEIEDAASLPVSLNLQGWKRPKTWPRIAGVMSCPRLGFLDNHMCAIKALEPLRIPVKFATGAYWGQCMTRGIEEAIEAFDPEYLLTLDYDSVYTQHTVEILISAMMRHPCADAVGAIQAHRKEPRPLFSVHGGAWRQTQVPRDQFSDELFEVRSMGFGLTLIRRAALEKLAKPWFHSAPNKSGTWGEGRLDDDVSFWRKWVEAELSAYVACRAVIAHAELMLRWPGPDLSTVVHQHPNDFWLHGAPEDQIWL